MSSGATAQDKTWKDRESASEASYIHNKEREQIEAIRNQSAHSDSPSSSETKSAPDSAPREDRPYEAGFGGQEDLEDRYATTSGEH